MAKGDSGRKKAALIRSCAESSTHMVGEVHGKGGLGGGGGEAKGIWAFQSFIPK